MNRLWNAIFLGVVTWSCLLADATQAADASWEKVAAAIRTVQDYKDGDPSADLTFLGAEVIEAARDAGKRKAMEQWILRGLAGARTRAGRDFFCRQLVVVGSEAAVGELARLLADPESSHMARYALARIPGRAADAALLDALGKVDETLKIGMVSSLGTRGCREAVGPIEALVHSSRPELAAGALTALGRIDSEAAVAAVAGARQRVPAKLKAAATDALLHGAARMARQGKAAEATAIYRKLLAPDEPSLCRVAALTGLVSVQRETSVSTVIAALADQDAQLRRVAAAALRYVPGAEATKAVVGSLAGQSEEVQVLLLAVLADRRDVAALPAVVKSAQAASPNVRLAALAALAALGDASVVPMLAERAAAAQEPAEQQAARASLNSLRGGTINAAIARQLQRESAGVEAARSLAARGAADQMEALFRAAQGKHPAVAAEALKALRILADSQQMPALVKLLTGTKDASRRAEAESAVVAVAATTPAGANPAAAVLAAMTGAAEPEVRASLVRVLGRIAHPSALPVLEQSAKDARAEVKDAAIRALSDWPGAEPANLLLGIATDPSASRVHRVLALRGYVNLIAKQSQATDDRILADYARAIQIAQRTEEKLLVLSKLSLLRDRRAMEMAQRLAGEPGLKQAAEAAIQSIQRLLASPARVTASKNPEKAPNAIDKDPKTRWDTGAAMSGGEWFKIELDEERMITGLVLDTRGSGGDYPRGYEIYVSSTGLADGHRVATGKGTGPLTRIIFAKPVRGKAIKIVQTGQSQGSFWSIHELTVEK